jgi:hypothetical protein
MTYQPGIPTGSVPLNQDYLNIQGNFTELNTQFEVDHVPLTSTSGSPPNGYHTSIHLVPQATPSNAGAYGQVYSTTINDGFSSDQALFFQTGTGNNNYQLTRNFLPVAATNGRSFIAGPAGTGMNQGSIVIQWGNFVASPQSETAVTFAGIGGIAFPNNCFNFQATLNDASTSVNTLNVSSVTKTGFTYYNTSSSTKRYYWLAIGN